MQMNLSMKGTGNTVNVVSIDATVTNHAVPTQHTISVINNKYTRKWEGGSGD